MEARPSNIAVQRQREHAETAPGRTVEPKLAQPFRSTEPCGHFNAEQVGVIEAALSSGGWEYRTAYRCPRCGACFVEVHAQTMPRRREVDAI